MGNISNKIKLFHHK